MELQSDQILISYPDGSADSGFPVRVIARARFPLFFGSFFPSGVVDENGDMPIEGAAEMIIM